MAEVAKNIEKINDFLMFLIFWLLSCQDDLLIDFLLIFDQFGGRKSTKNRSKIDPKGDRKQDASWDGFWMALGSIFGRFWAQVGGQVGAKLAPKSEEMGYQDDVKKSSKIWRRKGTQGYVSGPGSWPLKNPSGIL